MNIQAVHHLLQTYANSHIAAEADNDKLRFMKPTNMTPL